jgi:transposase InsO family protein
MTGSSSSLFNYHPIDTPHSVTLANGSRSNVAGSGHTHLSPDIELLSVLHVPGFPFNLLSISKIIKALNCSISFYPSVCIFQDLKTRRMIGMGHEVGGLYYLDLTSTSSQALQLSTSTSTSALQWHCRLGHPSLASLKHQVPHLRHESSVPCEACQLSKHHRVPFPSRVVRRVSSPFELIHFDVWGPINLESNKFHYFVTFVDDFSRMTWLFLMKNHSELFSIFQVFRNMIKTQFAQKIHVLRSDNVKEYTSNSFASYLSEKGIIHQTSCAHTPQQNGVAERKNRHLLEVARCLLFHMHVPKQFWSDAVLTACYLINRMPSLVLDGVSPHSLLYPSTPPFPLPLKVFGCICYVHNLGPGYDKLDPRATKCVFLGYSTTQKGYRCYSPVSRHYLTPQTYPFVLSTQNYEVFPWKSIWHSKVPSWVAFFGWTAALGKILTHDNLRKRNIVIVEWCCM